jgi:hypothetical protein
MKYLMFSKFRQIGPHGGASKSLCTYAGRLGSNTNEGSLISKDIGRLGHFEIKCTQKLQMKSIARFPRLLKSIPPVGVGHPVSLCHLDPFDLAPIDQADSADLKDQALVADRNFSDLFRIPNLITSAVAANQRERPEFRRIHESAKLIDNGGFRAPEQ